MKSPDESVFGQLFRKGGCFMEIIYMLFDIMAKAADIVTLLMFIDMVLAKRNDKRNK